MNNKILELKGLFLRKVSLSHDVDDEILKKLDEILYFIDSSNIDDLRVGSAELSNELHKLGFSPVPYLLKLLLDKMEAVSHITNRKDKEINHDTDLESFSVFFERCFELCAKKGGIRILDFELPCLDETEQLNIYCCTRDMLDKYVSEPIDITSLNSEIPPRAICLGISKVLSNKFDCQHEFFIQFSSILDRMNLDGLYQEARDYAEEALLCSHDSGVLYYGHYTRFSIYTSQTNIIDSFIHGCLLFTSLCKEKSVSKKLMEISYTKVLLALRTFRFFDIAKKTYKTHISILNLDEFDRQKIDVAMFYMKIMENDLSVVSDVEIYICAKKDKILNFGKSSLIPWFTLICNIKTLFNKEYNKSKNINEFESIIESKLTIKDIKSIKGKILKGNPEGKDILIDGLVNLSRTRNRADSVYEVNQLIVTANRVIESSLNNEDVEGVLLGHQLNSDSDVGFVGNPIELIGDEIHHSFNIEGENLSRFKNYLTYIYDSFKDIDSQFVWIGFNDGKVYAVVFEKNVFTFFGYLESTNKIEIKSWIKNNLQDLAFNDSPNISSILITREDIWLKEKISIVKSLPNFNIPLSLTDIVLFSDVGFSSFPHNLIKINGDMLGLKQAVSSPLSFDNYLKYKDKKIDLTEINVWAPIVEDDIAISIAFSKIKENLDNAKAIFEEGAIPKSSSEVNVFISHGGRDAILGFRGLYPSDGKAYDIENIFGTGKVAILFVCHAGSIVESYYSNSTHTLVKKLLQDGYEAVISPSWSLNVSVPGIWMKEFIKNMENGHTISYSVNKANLYVESIYISPGASSAMHLFGNDRLTST